MDDSPYTLTIVPEPLGASCASLTESFRSAMNWSTTGTVNRVTAMCTAAGPVSAFKCQPFFPILSPTSSTLTPSAEPLRTDANATTDARGSPRIRNSGISERMRSAIVRAAVTIVLQDSK